MPADARAIFNELLFSMADYQVSSRTRIDRISDLPSNIIDDILSRVPLRDAAKTSVLSKKWRYMWLNVPSLVFNHHFGIIPFEYPYPEDKMRRVLSDVYRILLRHRGPLQTFTLCVGNLRESPFVDQIMLYLSRSDVENLRLSTGKYEIPSYLFSMPKLKRLSLEHSHFLPPSCSIGFYGIKYLEFDHVVLKSVLDDFILKCPFLSELKVHYCCLDSESLELDAPNLKYFSFRGDFWYISFKNVPVLEEVVNLPISGSLLKFVIGYGSIFSKVLGRFSLVKSLSVSHRYLEYLGIGGLPDKYTTNIEFLEIWLLDFEDMYAVSSVLCLIRSSPNLQGLLIESWPDEHKSNPDDREVERSSNPNSFAGISTAAELIGAQKIQNYISNKLRRIELLYLTDSKSTMEFVKFLLSISPHLEKMVISAFDADSSKEFDRFQRASPKAEVFVDVLM